MKIAVLDIKGAKVKSVDVSDAIWGVPMNEALLHQAVVAQQANRRQGTHETQDRGDVSYSKRKLHPQKVGGRARLGSRSSPSMVGGAVAHGPHRRSYTQKLPSKMRRQALFVALSSKLRQDQIKVIDALNLPEMKTRPLALALDKLAPGKNVLLVTEDLDRDLVKASQNIPAVSVLVANQLSPLQTTTARTLVITQDAVAKIEAIWGKGEKAPPKKTKPTKAAEK